MNVRRAPPCIVIPSEVEGSSLCRSGVLHTGGHVKIAWGFYFTLSCRLRFTGVQERFFAYARNDDARKDVMQGSCIFSLLPLEGGAPKGRRLAPAAG